MFEYYRPANFGVMRATFRIVMLFETFLQIIRASDIERFVGAFEDIDEIHTNILAPSRLLARGAKFL